MTERRVLCVGANPSFDITIKLAALERDRVNRADDERREAAGKAANCACVLAAQGVPVTLTGVFGEASFGEWKGLFAQRPGGETITLSPVLVPGRTRENLTILAGDEVMTEVIKINRSGAGADEHTVAALERIITESIRPGDVAAFCGSLPQGLNSDELVGLMRLAADCGASVAVDTEALSERGLVSARPWLYKPNEHELARLCSLPDGTPDEELVRCAHRLTQSGVGAVLLTLGARGLVLVTRAETVTVPPRPIKAINNVGAGDAALAAYIAAFLRGQSPSGCARAAAQAGERAASGQGSGI